MLDMIIEKKGLHDRIKATAKHRHPRIGRHVHLADAVTALLYLSRCAPAVGHPHARYGEYHRQRTFGGFSVRLPAGHSPSKPGNGVGLNYFIRFRPDVADVQLRGPIHGSWNRDCV